MTRINVVAAEELSDQWLLAEYRELPRVIKGTFNLSNAPEKYCLGKGHVKFCKAHSYWVMKRYYQLCKEMEYRGFKMNYSYLQLATIQTHNDPVGALALDYRPTDNDIKLNRERLIEKYRDKPDFYKWTGREKPEWLEI